MVLETSTMRTHYCVITALVLFWIILFIPTKIVACDKNELTFGNISICVNQNGNILYKRSLGKEHIIVVDLPYKNTLHFVKVGNTNIVKVERYYNAWIVLLQTYKREDEKTPATLACDTKKNNGFTQQLIEGGNRLWHLMHF